MSPPPTPRLPLPSPVVGVPGNAPGFSPQQLEELADARRRSGTIRTAVLIALIDGWSMAVFAGLSMLCGIFSPLNLVVGAVLGIVAWVELTAVSRVKRLDPTAARTLGFNQLALAGLMIGYAAYHLMSPSAVSQGMLGAAGSPADLAAAGIDVEKLERRIRWIVYGAVIAVAVFAQGSLAVYYLSRGKKIRAFVADSPPWIVQMYRAGYGG